MRARLLFFACFCLYSPLCAGEFWMSGLLPSDRPVDVYVNPESGCAVISTSLALSKMGESATLEGLVSEFSKFGAEPYSLLDIMCVLDKYGVKAEPVRFDKKSDIFNFDFNYAILYLNEGGQKVGHFSFCFRGKDGGLWIADPKFAGRCVLFAKDSRVFDSFTGIIVKMRKPSESKEKS